MQLGLIDLYHVIFSFTLAHNLFFTLVVIIVLFIITHHLSVSLVLHHLLLQLIKAIFLLDLLLEQSANILKLPVKTTIAECTIQRFYLLLWPLLNLAESGDYAKAKE